jgi:hypothetical protein
MGQRHDQNKTERWIREGVVCAGVIVAAWYFVHLRYSLNQEFPLATLSSFLDGTAYRPFQFRMLIPWLVGGLQVTGLGELTLYRILDALSVVGIFYSFRYYLSGFIDRDVAGLMSFSVFYALPWNYLLARDIPILLPYDLPSIALLTLALAFLHRRKWIPFFVVFALGALNRETIVFVVIPFVLVEFGRQSRRDFVLQLAGLLGIWIAVKATMAMAYAGNPGSAFEFYHVGTTNPHWKSNIQMLVTGPHLLLMLSNFGFAWVIVLAGWRHLSDPFLRKTLWIIPPYLLLVLIAGNANEIRVYGELLPVIMAPAAMITISLASTLASRPAPPRLEPDHRRERVHA